MPLDGGRRIDAHIGPTIEIIIIVQEFLYRIQTSTIEITIIVHELLYRFGQSLSGRGLPSLHFAFRPLPIWIIWPVFASSARTLLRVPGDAIERASAARSTASQGIKSLLWRYSSTNSIALARSVLGRPTLFLWTWHTSASVASLKPKARSTGTSSFPPPSRSNTIVLPKALALAFPWARASRLRSLGSVPRKSADRIVAAKPIE